MAITTTSMKCILLMLVAMISVIAAQQAATLTIPTLWSIPTVVTTDADSAVGLCTNAAVFLLTAFSAIVGGLIISA